MANISVVSAQCMTETHFDLSLEWMNASNCSIHSMKFECIYLIDSAFGLLLIFAHNIDAGLLHVLLLRI